MFWPESPLDYEFYIAEAERDAERVAEQETARHEAHMRDLAERRARVCRKTARSLAEYYARYVSGTRQQNYVIDTRFNGPPIMSSEFNEYETVWMCSDGVERNEYDIRDEMKIQIREHCPELTERLDIFVLADEALEIFKGIAK